MLIEKIKKDRIQAMKDKDVAKRSTLQLLIADLEKEKVKLLLSDINDLSQEQVENVIRRNIKAIDKEIESYRHVSHETFKQEAEKELLFTYLPQQLSEEEIRVQVAHAIHLVKRGEIENQGKAMGYLSQKLKGKADMGLVSRIAKEEFKK